MTFYNKSISVSFNILRTGPSDPDLDRSMIVIASVLDESAPEPLNHLPGALVCL